MAKLYWVAGRHGQWSDTSNWVGRVEPGAHDIAAFYAPTYRTDNVMGDASVGEVLVSGQSVTFAGSINISGSVIGPGGRPIGSPSLVVDRGGRLVVQDALNAQSSIDIGRYCGGELVVAGGEVSTACAMVVGDSASGNGTLDILGSGLASAESLVVGNYGSGTLNINTGLGPFDSNDLQITHTMYVGRYAGSHGVINLVNGSLDSQSYGGGLIIGSGGSGLVIVGAQAGIYGGYTVESHGQIRMEGGFLGGFFGTVEAGGLVSGSGQVTTLGVVNDGTIRATGDLLLDSRTQGEGPAEITGHGTLEVGAFATLDATNVFLSGQTVRFVGSHGTLAIPSAFSSTQIGGFAIGDVIRPEETLTAIIFHASTDTLTLYNHGAAIDTLHFAGSFAGEHFDLGHDSHGAIITVLADSKMNAVG